ncbi:MAG: hypothetical protein IJT41_07205 [Clostridia bacterium]|nr:hypothetical protein [Clostridia bacterium]
MMQDKFLSLLGMCRAAGRLGWGHDACMASVTQGTAKICLLSADASDRLRRSFHRAAQDRVPVLDTRYTMQDFAAATGGLRAGVLTTEDAGFAAKLAALYTMTT